MSRRNTSNLYGLIFVGLLTASFSGLFVDNAEAKTMSIWERQKTLMADVNRGQKSKQLTVEEAKGLRQDLAAIARKKAKMLRDNESMIVNKQSEVGIDFVKNSFNEIMCTCVPEGVAIGCTVVAFAASVATEY